MRIINKSRKIIGICGEPLLPGKDLVLPEGMEDSIVIKGYLADGIVADADKEAQSANAGTAISDAEKERIAQEAIEKYKAQQEANEAVENDKASEIKAVKAMKKDELLTKAAGLGLEVSDNDTVDVLKEKILAALAN